MALEKAINSELEARAEMWRSVTSVLITIRGLIETEYLKKKQEANPVRSVR